jgi:cation/acetate symporter
MNGSANLFTTLVFLALLALTVYLLVRASRRTTSTSDFWAAGHSISGPQNGVAISGDFLGAATMLGSVGLIMLYGFDGALYSLGWLVGFLTVLFFAGERLRNAGRYTISDALTLRLRERPVRCAIAVNTVLIAIMLLVTQLIAAGVLLETLTGLNYPVALVITAVGLLAYVMFGGMISVTWLQITKALILLTITLVIAVWVLAKAGMDPGRLLSEAAARSPHGERFLQPGLYLTHTVNTVSLGIALVFGVAGLPHLLMRFFTVPDKIAARRSVGWAVGLVGLVYLLTIIVGVGARAYLSPGEIKAAGKGGNLAAPVLVQKLGGGPDSWGGQLFLAVFAAAAFATVLALVAGLAISASSAVSHDIFAGAIRRGKVTERAELRAGRLTTLGFAAVGIVLALALKDKNVVFLAGLVYSVAASANFPVLLLTLFWRRFSTFGAVLGVIVGTTSSVALIVVSPGVWPGDNPPVSLTNPAIVSVPLGFLACWLGAVLRPEPAAQELFAQVSVRSTTGIGAAGVRS